MFWDFLYQLNDRDRSLPQLVFGYNQGTTSGLSTPLTIEVFTVPNDQVAIVMCASVVGTPAAATTLLRLTAEALDPTGSRTPTWYMRDFQTPAALVSSVATLAGAEPFMLVPPGYRFRVKADFSAITGNNSMFGEASWIYLPRGNFSLP